MKHKILVKVAAWGALAASIAAYPVLGFVTSFALLSFFIVAVMYRRRLVVALSVAVARIVLKDGLFVVTRAAARRAKSTALEANAWHHRSDALSSVPVVAAIAVAWFFPSLWWADAAGALVVSAVVAHVAWNLGSSFARGCGG